jgi:hypothetical protein
MTIREKALGPDHPDVAASMEGYAFCLRAMDRSQEAEEVDSRANAIRRAARSRETQTERNVPDSIV